MIPGGRALAPGLLLLLPACGHRGDPLPPLRRTPPALTDFRFAQRGDSLEVSLRTPTASIDGVALERLTVEILWAEGVSDLEKAGRRREVTATPGQWVVEQLPAPAPGTLVRAAARAAAGRDAGPRTLILALNAQAPLEVPTGLAARLEAGGVVLEWNGAVPDPVPPPDLAPLGGPGARSFGTDGGPERPDASRPPTAEPAPPAASDLQPEETATPAPPTVSDLQPEEAATPAPPAASDLRPDETATPAPPAASDLKPEETATPVPLPMGAESAGEKNAPAPDIAHGFSVYRRAGSAPYERPLNEAPTLERRLVDSSPPLGERACYVVRAVASAKPLIESAASNEACVDVSDIVAPSAPTGVAVLPREDGLEIVWTPSPEADLAGYRVYRQSGEDEPVRVAEVRVGTSTWVDNTAEPGQLHRYSVSALDAAGNESARSSVAEGRRR